MIFSYDNHEYIYPDFSENGLLRKIKNNKWGVIDEKGKEIFPCKYGYVYPLKEGLATVRTAMTLKSTDSKYGYINEKGEEVISLIYDWADDFYKGLAIVKFNSKWGIINKKGETILPFIYDSVIRYDDKIAVKLNNKCGFMDINNLSVFNEFMNYIVNIGSRNDTLYYTRYKDTYMLKTGCFFGDLKDFKEAVYGAYDYDEVFYNQYMKVINELKSSL